MVRSGIKLLRHFNLGGLHFAIFHFVGDGDLFSDLEVRQLNAGWYIEGLPVLKTISFFAVSSVLISPDLVSMAARAIADAPARPRTRTGIANLPDMGDRKSVV